MTTLVDKSGQDTRVKEELEVQFYTQTIQQAQLNEVADVLIGFIEEFARRIRREYGDNSVSGAIRDMAAFKEMEDDE